MVNWSSTKSVHGQLVIYEVDAWSIGHLYGDVYCKILNFFRISKNNFYIGDVKMKNWSG